MSEDEWDYMPGTWNVFENLHGWRMVLDTGRLPARWSLDTRKEYAAAMLWALNHGQPNEDDKLNIAKTSVVQT